MPHMIFLILGILFVLFFYLLRLGSTSWTIPFTIAIPLNSEVRMISIEEPEVLELPVVQFTSSSSYIYNQMVHPEFDSL